jgi:hypothetical protein
VEKFYNFTYPNDYEERHQLYKGDLEYVKAIQLWNDWNVQAHTWAKQHPDQLQYLMIRTEDLLHNNRLQTIQAIAQFVGSPRTFKEICCLSQQQTQLKTTPPQPVKRLVPQSMKKKTTMMMIKRPPPKIQQQQQQQQQQLLHRRLSEVDSTNHTAMLKEKYGKWRKVLLDNNNNKTNTLLKDYFYKEAKDGLQLFGYHPYRDIDYYYDNKSSSNSTTRSVSCDDDVTVIGGCPVEIGYE